MNAKKFITKTKLLVSVLFVISIVLTFGVACSNSNNLNTSYNNSSEVVGFKHYDNYSIEQMTVLSRHNLRSPIQGEKSILPDVTTHEWFNWTSPSGELSLLGGAEEVFLGQYFKKFLISENFMPENWIPQNNEVNFYTNSFQRTIATAQSFATGMLPVANQTINHLYSLGGKDETFLVDLNYDTEKFEKAVYDEAKSYGGNDSLQEVINELNDELEFVSDMLDFKNSKYAKEHNMTKLTVGDAKINFEEGEETTYNDELMLANDICDALILQYMEEEDDVKAGFGKKYSFEDWKKVAHVCDLREYLCFRLHSIAVNIANQILVELQKDMHENGRKFTFLCGHDSTIYSLFGALKVKEYNLPNHFTQSVPIGSKFVITKYKNKIGEEFATINLVYATIDQIRHRQSLDLNNPAQVVPLELEGLEKNADGMYKFSDIEKRFNDSIAEFELYK